MEGDTIKNKLKSVNILGISAILVWFIYIITAISAMLTPNPEVGSNLLIDKDILPIDLRIVECDCENIYLFDNVRNKLFVYDKNGENTLNFDFRNSGSIQIIDINESERQLTVFYSGLRKNYLISFSGEVMSITDSSLYNTEVQNYVGEYSVFNYFFWYSVHSDEGLLTKRISMQPFLVIGIFVFFGGLLSSHKRLRSISNSAEEEY